MRWFCPWDWYLQSHAEESSITLTPKLANYRWETTADGTTLKNITTEGYTRNPITNLNGTVNGATLTDVYGKFADTITLLPTDEWAIEWKSEGTWEGMLISKTATYSTTGNVFVYHPEAGKPYTLGVRSKFHGTGYWNYGFTESLVEAAFTAAGKTFVASDVHVFRIENRIDGNTNLPYLIIDDVVIGAMTNVYKGSSTTTSYTNDTSWSGQTIQFNYLGATGSSKELQAKEFEYLEITGAHTHTGAWTKGETEMTRTCTTCGAEETAPYTAYRWEVNNDVFASVATDGYYVENALTGTYGTIEDGAFTDVRRTLNTGVTLKHNQPWVIQWNAKGNWTGILLSSHSGAVAGMDILFKKNNTSDNRPGLVIGGRASYYTNYGVKMSAVKDYFADFAVWRLENVVNNDGTNMVFLYINDTFIADMTYYFKDANATDGTKGDYVNGRDLYYKYIGMGTSHDITGMTLDYLEIWPNGKPVPAHECVFNIEKEVVKGEDCEHVGYTVWACECGETETRPNEVYGDHDYYAETEGEPGEDCQHSGEDMFVCSVCGDDYTAENGILGDHSYKLISSTVGADCETAGVDTYECEFCEDSYTVANDKFGDHSYGDWYHNGICVLRTCTVCENHSETAKYSAEGTTDGVVYYYFGYQDFAEALNAAPAGYNITLWADAQIDELLLTEGRYLNLMGHVLTTNAAVVNNGSQIYNAGAEIGYLKVPQGALILPSTTHELAIWNGVDGYIFEDCEKYQTLIETPRAGNTIFYFLPEMPEYVHDYLANGGATLKVRLSWTVEGQQDSRVVVASSELMSNFYAGYADGKYAYAFKLNVTGTDLIDEDSLVFEAFFESCGTEYVLTENA